MSAKDVAETACLLLLRHKKPGRLDVRSAVHMADVLHKLSLRKHKMDLDLCNYGANKYTETQEAALYKKIEEVEEVLKHEYDLRLIKNKDPRGAALRLQSETDKQFPSNSFGGGWAV